MISGNVRKASIEGDIVRLTVRGTGGEHYDELDVRIKNENRAKWFTNALGKTQVSVWWQSNRLFASFGELSGYEFTKISTTSNHRHI